MFSVAISGMVLDWLSINEEDQNMLKKIALVSMACFALSGCWETQSGEKIGQITRVAQQGAVVKTWEAEIIRGGLSSGSGVNGSAFHFTIENDELLKKVQKAMADQSEVKITFSKEMVSFLRSESNSNFLKSVDLLHPAPVAETAPDTKQVVGNPAKQERILQLLRVQAELLKELAQN